MYELRLNERVFVKEELGLKRMCIRCNKTITECNGFVLARDYLDAIAGKVSWYRIRELCGKCVLKFENRFLDLQKLLRRT